MLRIQYFNLETESIKTSNDCNFYSNHCDFVDSLLNWLLSPGQIKDAPKRENNLYLSFLDYFFYIIK